MESGDPSSRHLSESHNDVVFSDDSTPESHLSNSLTPPENYLPDAQLLPGNKNLSPHLETTPEPRVSNTQHEESIDDTSEPVTENPNTDQTGSIEPGSAETGPPPKKRRRRKKQFPEMISLAAAVNGLRVLRLHVKSSVYSEIIQTQIDDTPLISKNRQCRISDLTKEVDVEALIAISVGFPVDSLIEEEIEVDVVSEIDSVEQANYIVVRSHILARWRSNVSMWMTREHALEMIRIEHIRA